VKIKCI